MVSKDDSDLTWTEAIAPCSSIEMEEEEEKERRMKRKKKKKEKEEEGEEEDEQRPASLKKGLEEGEKIFSFNKSWPLSA